jgi:hypothetical protein
VIGNYTCLYRVGLYDIFIAKWHIVHEYFIRSDLDLELPALNGRNANKLSTRA